MTFRGVYRKGVVVPKVDPDIPDGTEVRCVPEAGRRPGRASVKAKQRKPVERKRRQMNKAERLAAIMQAFGMYKDRPDWKGRSTAHIADALRASALGNRFRG